MRENPYLILEIYESATESEVDFAYRRLKSQLSEQRFRPGEEGAIAAEKLTELEEAYKEIKQKFAREKAGGPDYANTLKDIEDLIKLNKISDAQSRLDEINERTARWHYLQSIVFYKKGWYDESKSQLEMAVSMEPANADFKDALNRLNIFMSGQAGNIHQQQKPNQSQDGYRAADEQYTPGNQNQQNQQGQNYQGQQGPYRGNEQRGMGGCGGNDAGTCCTQLICADCCCECMGGDLLLCC